MIRNPGRQLIIFHQPLPKGLNPHKPGRDSLIDERGLAPPTEGITVLDRALVNEVFCLFELLDDFGVGFFDMQAHKIPDIRGKPTVIIDRVHQGNTRLLAGIKILFPKGRGHMDDAGPVFGGHMLGLDDPKSARLFLIDKIGKQRDKRPSGEVFTLIAGLNGVAVFLGEVGLEPGLGHNITDLIRVVADFHIVDVRADG